MNKDKNVVAIVAAVPTNIGFTKERREQAKNQFM